MKVLLIQLAVAIVCAVIIVVVDNLTGYPFNEISNLQGFGHNALLIATGIAVWNVGGVK